MASKAHTHKAARASHHQKSLSKTGSRGVVSVCAEVCWPVCVPAAPSPEGTRRARTHNAHSSSSSSQRTPEGGESGCLAARACVCAALPPPLLQGPLTHARKKENPKAHTPFHAATKTRRCCRCCCWCKNALAHTQWFWLGGQREERKVALALLSLSLARAQKSCIVLLGPSTIRYQKRKPIITSASLPLSLS